MKSCTPKHVQRSMKAILDINLFSKQLYLEMQKSSHFDFHLETKGLLMAYKTSHAEKEEAEVVVQAKDLGLKIEQLSPEEVLKKQPGTSMDIAGAFWYESDAHSTPELFMQNLITLLRESGVNFVLEQEVTNFKLKNNKIQSVVTTHQDLKADEVIVASGAWSESLLKQLKIQHAQKMVSKLDKHEWDEDCSYCMANPWLKETKQVADLLPKLIDEEQVIEFDIKHFEDGIAKVENEDKPKEKLELLNTLKTIH